MSFEPVETRLIEATQPIRSFTLAICLYHLFDTGVYDLMIQREAATAAALADELQFEEARLEGFLKYLKNEGVFTERNGVFRLTEKGKSYSDFRAWYTMLIGGYAETFLQVGGALPKGSPSATRNSMKVGVGSCGISHYDAIPMTRRLMDQVPGGCKKLLDLGCGNGQYLVEFCKQLPEIEAWGVEPSEGGYQEAHKLVQAHGLEGRIKLSCATAQQFFEQDFEYEPDFIVLGFILHEILGQEGEAGVERFLTRVVERFPNINIIVIEVDDRIDDPSIMQHGLSLAYYNPYYLLHYFTRQKLESKTYWEALFARCGLEILAEDTVDHEVDSTNLELGYLIRRGGSR